MHGEKLDRPEQTSLRIEKKEFQSPFSFLNFLRKMCLKIIVSVCDQNDFRNDDEEVSLLATYQH